MILSLIILSGCDKTPEKEQIPSRLDSCERFEYYVTGCWCDDASGKAIIYETDFKSNKTDEVEAFVEKYYLENDGVMKEARCVILNEENFMNCFLDEEYYATYWNGDLFKTICGV